MRFQRRMLRVVLLAVLCFTAGTALPITGGSAAAQAGPVQPLLCFEVFTSGVTPATLAVVKAQGDGAVDYQVVKNYVPATGTFQQVAVLTNQLSMSVTLENHWVRSRNAQGSSAWVSCETYERISSIDTVAPQDYRRPGEEIKIGFDGNGWSPTMNGYRVFEGEDDDIVVTDASNSPVLAPNGGKMAWRVKFRIAQGTVQGEDGLAFLQAANGKSWNLMQRGLANDNGGQWKMSILSTPTNKVAIQCWASDFNGPNDNMQSESTFDLSNLSITNGYTPWITATCFADDTGPTGGSVGGTLQVVVSGVGDAEVVDSDFGTLLPEQSSMCNNGPTPLDPNLFPGGIGNVVTVGNKPACYGPNTNDDGFIGHLDNAEIWKLTPLPNVALCNGLTVTVDVGAGESATSGNDVILGTTGADTINGLGGSDTICGLGGDDVISGGNGSDLIFAGGGNDTVDGGVASDVIHGGSGADVLSVDPEMTTCMARVKTISSMVVRVLTGCGAAATTMCFAATTTTITCTGRLGAMNSAADWV